MIVVVSDSGPVRYLAVLGLIDLLPKLFDRIILPQSVIEEITHPHAPVEVQTWARNLPPQVEIREAATIELSDILGPGEAEAIALAEELRADLVLIDDRDAQRIAKSRHLVVAGTIGVLERAAARDLVNLTDALERLSATNFRIAPSVIQDALAREEQRRAGHGREHGDRAE